MFPKYLTSHLLTCYHVTSLLATRVILKPFQNILKFLLKNLKPDTVLFGSTRGVFGTELFDLSLSLDIVGDVGTVHGLSSLINKGLRGICLSASRRISLTVSRNIFSTSLNSPAADTSWNEHAY